MFKVGTRDPSLIMAQLPWGVRRNYYLARPRRGRGAAAAPQGCRAVAEKISDVLVSNFDNFDTSKIFRIFGRFRPFSAVFGRFWPFLGSIISHVAPSSEIRGMRYLLREISIGTRDYTWRREI